ncbi:MAG: ABC transporter permease [Eubacteriales bacterium]
MAVFIIVPLALIAVFAFTTTVTTDADGNILSDEEILAIEDEFSDEDGNLEDGHLFEKTVFTWANILEVSRYMTTLLNSIWLALVATVICLVLAYPVSYFISRLHFSRQKMMLMLVMLPMWMNFLLRTYAWMTLLEKNGIINQLLGLIGIGPLQMINTPGAVVLGMVYNYLPFMIMPIYSVMTKIDVRSIEAAQDLGANSLQVMTRVVIPLSMPGVASGITMVFVPAVSTFIISRMLGGGTNMLIGDLIDLQFLGNAYNPNLGAAMSLVLMVFILLCMSITNSLDNEDMEAALL